LPHAFFLGALAREDIGDHLLAPCAGGRPDCAGRELLRDLPESLAVVDEGRHDREGAVTTAIGQMLPDEAGQRAGRSDIDEVEVPGLRLEHVLQRLTKQDGLAPDLPEMFIGQRLDPRPGPAGNDRYARRSKVKRCAGEGHGRAGGVDRRRVKAVRDGQLDGADAQPLQVAQDNFKLLADAGNHEMLVVVDTGQGAALVQYRVAVVECRVVQYGQHHARLAVSFDGMRLLDQGSQHRLGRDGPGQRRRHEFAQAAAKQVIGGAPRAPSVPAQARTRP
jgi:hypothetical protein